MRIIRIIGTTIILLFAFCSISMAAENIKIGVIDIQKFQKKSVAFQKVRMELQKRYNQLQAKLDKEKQELMKLEEEFKKQSLMLSLDAKQDKKLELDKKRRYYRYLYEEVSSEMQNLQREATRRVGKELEKVVEKLGKQYGYTLILEKRTIGLIFYDEAIDITDKVIEAYDKSHSQ